MGFDKDRAIIAQNSAAAAANIVAAEGVWDADRFDEVRTHIFQGTLALAGAAPVAVSAVEAVQEAFPGAELQGVPSSSSNDAGDVVLNFGKHKGKTIAQVQASDPGWLDWVLDKSNNQFIVGKVREFRAA